MFAISTNKIVDALKPQGPTPIVTTITGLGAFATLSTGANPLAVLVIAFLVLATHIYGLERSAALKRKELDIEIDRLRAEESRVTIDEFRKRFDKLRESREFDRVKRGGE